MKKLKAKPTETKLEKAVRLIINNHLSGYDDNQLEGFIRDLQQCVSGMIGELVYYSATTAFFQKHKTEINELLNETRENFGGNYSPADIFGDKWDNEDPLAFDAQNQNLLAWFAFEETAFRLVRDAGIDV